MGLESKVLSAKNSFVRKAQKTILITSGFQL